MNVDIVEPEYIVTEGYYRANSMQSEASLIFFGERALNINCDSNESHVLFRNLKTRVASLLVCGVVV